jgi:anti-sigma B factor antagonist
MSDQLTVEQRDGALPDVIVLTLTGPLNLHTMSVLQTAFRGISASRTVLELSGVPHIDSAGLGVLMSFLVAQQKTGKAVVLANLSKRVKVLFELTKIDTVMKIFPTVADAEQG